MILHGAGAEIYLRSPDKYSIDAASQTAFADVAKRARQQKEIALGYLLQDGTVVTAPGSGHKQCLTAGDQIIVLADQA